MSSFKLAAIKILRDRKQLHYKDITELAIEKGLIETSGATPEATMHALLSRDIKLRGNKSAFINIDKGIFGLNIEQAKFEEKEIEIEEREEEADFKQKTKNQYTGKAGEHVVLSELLFRNFNAGIVSVDDGMDIVAVKNNKLYNIQVKTANENSYDSYVFDLRISSFEKHNANNSYYIFVLRDKNKITEFIIMSQRQIQENIKQSNIKTVNKETRYRLNIKKRDNKIYLGNRSNDITNILNKWDQLKIK